MPSIDEQIKKQEEFVKAISYQKEVATNAYYDAREYLERITAKYDTESSHLKEMRERS